MKKSGAFLTVYALEQIGVQYTFGIPGVHNTEIYDALNNSKKIHPILVTHEGGAAFMADGVSRTSDSIGTLVIVPAAGLTHAMSGIGEAYLDGIPMLIISGGTRHDSGKSYQLHQIDQSRMLDGLIKQYFLIERHAEIVPTIFKAYETAISGEPGPVFVEVPAEIQMFRSDIRELPVYTTTYTYNKPNDTNIQKAADLLVNAKSPGIFLGWGAMHATEIAKTMADKLIAPVCTTLQGISVFPADHPFHTGVGFGASSVPASQEAFKNCDCLLAVATRFSELATGSYGVNPPDNLIHIDINPKVFNKNYPAKVAIEGDANITLNALMDAINERIFTIERNPMVLGEQIKTSKRKYYEEWLKKPKRRKVSPGHFFKALREILPDDAYMVVDDGKHTFLAAELFPVLKSRHFISPTDFNCMGYCVPAAIGTKISHPEHAVAAIVGDGAFLMTCMELVTATSQKAGVMVFVFNDGELGQISQFQKIPLNRKTCTKLGKINVEGVATATGAAYISLKGDHKTEKAIKEALTISKKGQPVIIDVNIDYSKKTYMTKGVVKTNLSRFPLSEKVRFLGRALKRHITG